MGQKQSILAGEHPPLYSSKRYTTDELNHILKLAEKVRFTHPDEFRAVGSSYSENDTFLKALLLDLEQAGNVYYEAPFEKSELENVRVSQSIPAQSIPYAMATLIKRAFMQWDLLDQPNHFLEEVHVEFTKRLNDAYFDLLDLLNKQEVSDSQKIDALSHILCAKREFQNPTLVYAAQTLFISFITALTKEKYTEEAKAIHQFIRVCKRMLEIQTDPEERSKVARLIVPVLCDGLHLEKASIVPEHVLETSQSGKIFRIYLAFVFNLMVRHPVFDEDYDKDTYSLYVRLDEKCQQMKIGVESNPALAARDLPDFFVAELNGQYTDLITSFYPSEENQAQKAVYFFFVNKIARVLSFDNKQKAADMHHVIFLLRVLYQEDTAALNDTSAYAKIMRQIFQLPSIDPVKDAWFDKIMVPSLLKRKQIFNNPFSAELYKVSFEDQQRYCQQLTEAYQAQAAQNSQLKAQLHEDKLKLESQTEEINRLHHKLEVAQQKLRDLLIDEYSESSSPQGSPVATPSSSPPTGRFHIHRRPRTSDEKSPPQERKLKHTLSASVLQRHKKPS